ncbi:MAG: thiol peroxidase, partial [Candidatus Aegiribacteria sp.]|nr:thiol peroxidase [Candidatus Aegiribacteria sp.]MBD3294229.1 thiol peroxidase [Candidatus Fermentibacteria bacterium]
MAEITFKGNRVNTCGDLPQKGTDARDFVLVNTDLEDVALNDYSGRTLLLNIFPSLDTPVCAMSVRKFNSEAAELDDISVLCISADLPFAHARFCETQGIENVENLSCFRSPEFGRDYGLEIVDGPLRGLLARAVIVIDP